MNNIITSYENIEENVNSNQDAVNDDSHEHTAYENANSYQKAINVGFSADDFHENPHLSMDLDDSSSDDEIVSNIRSNTR